VSFGTCYLSMLVAPLCTPNMGGGYGLKTWQGEKKKREQRADWREQIAAILIALTTMGKCNGKGVIMWLPNGNCTWVHCTLNDS
jgi:hypothetical protein